MYGAAWLLLYGALMEESMALEGEDVAVPAVSEGHEGADADAQEMPPSVESAQVAVPRPRLYRTRRLLDGLPEAEVIKLYRLSSNAIYSLYDILEPDLEPRVPTNHAVPGLAKLLASLHFFASGTFQPTVSLIAGFSQATFSRSLFQVLKALRKHTMDFIKFPEGDSEWREIKSDFFSIAAMPNVLGALDCMHVALTPPRQSAECFRNRKDFHSLNVQMVSDANQRILNVVVGFPGATHDSYILHQSALFRQIEEGALPYGWLLGDSGYRSRTWLLTPLSEPVTAAEKRFQSAHAATRGAVETTFAALKSRFRCLDRSGGVLLYSPSKDQDLSPVAVDRRDLGSHVRRHIIEDYFTSSPPPP